MADGTQITTGMQKMKKMGLWTKVPTPSAKDHKRIVAIRFSGLSILAQPSAAIMRPRVPAPVAPIHDSGFKVFEAIQTRPDSFNKA